MPLIETLTIEVGSSIAKSLLKLCLKDFVIATETSSSVIDVLKSWTSDRVTQHRTQRQIEAIGERVAESLYPLFELDGAGLDEGSRIAVAKAVAVTLNTTTSQVVTESDLEPSKLASYLLHKYPANIYHFNTTEEILYERIISEACEYIIRIASQMPTFTEHSFAEVLKREGQLLSIADQTLQEVLRIREQLNPKTEATRFELDYRRAVIYKLDEVQLFGTDIAIARRPYRLSVAYVTLSVERKKTKSSNWLDSASPKQIMATSAFQDEVTRDIVSVDEALARSRYLLIRGLAGSGKTTLLQWIAVNSASKSFSGTLEDWNGTLPFYIRLRRYVQEDFPAPEAFLKSVTPAIADKMPKGWVHAELESGRAIILVDGLDEVSEIKRESVRTWLKDLIKNYPKARFIVTSRPHAIEEGWLDSEGFKDAELQPMELPDILTFIDYWHAAIAEGLQSEEEKAELPFSASRLRQEIEEDRSKRNLATSPLLCAMLCALSVERRRQLPSDRIELYEACCQMLVERRDKERSISLSDYPASILTYTQKCVLLEDLAYWLIKNGWSEVLLEEADERFRRKLANMQNIPKTISGIDVRQLLVERSGIARAPTANRIDFVHRTFQEFFAAKAAVNEGDSGLLVQNAHNDQWHEVIILAAGLATKRVRESLILKLIARADSDQDHFHQINLLAVACLEIGIEHLAQHVRTEVEKHLSSLVPPRNMDSARALAAAGELAVPYLKKQYCRSETNSSTGIACIHALILIGSEEALKAIEDYAEDAQSAAIDELLKGWDVFDRGVYSRSVLARTLRNMSSIHLTRFVLRDGFRCLNNLTFLNLSKCDLVTDIIPLLNSNELKSLNLSNCSKINNLSFLTPFTKLTRLILSDCNQLLDLSPIAGLTQLTELDLSDCNQLLDLSPIAGLTQLTDLDLSGCGKLDDLGSLTGLTQLVFLDLTGCNQLRDLSPLLGLTCLNKLYLSDCSWLRDFSPLARMNQLTELDLSGCNELRDLGPLAGLSQLTELNLSGCDELRDLGPLAGLSQLTELNLSVCSQLRDLGPLKRMTRLKLLDLSYCLKIKDFDPLLELDHLKQLYLRGFSTRQIPANIKERVEIIWT